MKQQITSRPSDVGIHYSKLMNNSWLRQVECGVIIPQETGGTMLYVRGTGLSSGS